MKPLRVGAVNYLNTKPLIRRLAELAPEIRLELDLPSRLATRLATAELDVGLIPSIEYFRGDGYSIIPRVSISSYGPVMSVKLLSRVPFARIASVALDEGSRTSIALTKILLRELFDVEPAFSGLPIAQDPTAIATDAVLVIGDRAMRVADGTFPYTLDLGYEWSRWTGLPFVFAFWAVRSGVIVSPQTQEAFVQARQLAQPELAAIAASEAAHLGIDVTRCQYYLEHVIRHDFGDEEMAGLTRFYQLAEQHGLAPRGVQLVFHGSEHLAQIG